MMTKPKNKPKAQETISDLDKVPPLTKDMQRLLDIRKDSALWKQMIAKNLRGAAMSHRGRTKGEGSDPGNGNAQSSQPSLAPASPASALDLLSKLEQMYMKSRIDQLIAQSDVHMNYGELKNLLETCFGGPFSESGFDPYGSEDELGLHEGNADLPEYGLGQEDYEIEEVQDGEKFLYEYGPTHHIEVEVNSGVPRSDTPENEATCEFTFEYHRNGKLVESKQVPASGKLEDKLRQLSLVDVQGRPAAASKKNKKNPKAKKKTNERVKLAGSVDDSHCLFCQYEAFFGQKPIRTMEWLEHKAAKEEKRRARIKKKLNSAKMRTIRKYQNMGEDAEDLEQDESHDDTNASQE